MKLDFECVIKTAKNTEGTILRRAIYVDNKKEFENDNIDLENALKYYAPNNKWKEVSFVEDDISNLEERFPETDDFLYLLDYSEIYIGKTVYLSDGKHIITDYWKYYRPSGKYAVWCWEEIDGKYFAVKTEQFLVGHEIINFKVNDSNEIFVWEDWNYHQSFLYLNSIQYIKKTIL